MEMEPGEFWQAAALAALSNGQNAQNACKEADILKAEYERRARNWRHDEEKAAGQ